MRSSRICPKIWLKPRERTPLACKTWYLPRAPPPALSFKAGPGKILSPGIPPGLFHYFNSLITRKLSPTASHPSGFLPVIGCKATHGA